MKIQAPLYIRDSTCIIKEKDIILCDIECLNKTNTIIYTIKERVLYCQIRGLYSDIHYTKHLSKGVIKQTKIIKLVAVKKIGTAI